MSTRFDDFPPAYEDSQEEFDRKTSLALQQSVAYPQPLGTQYEEEGEEEEEEYNNVPYEGRNSSALNRNMSIASSSSAGSQASVRPLRVHKKSPSTASGMNEKRDSTLRPTSSRPGHRRSDSNSLDIDRSFPPPTFAAVPPSAFEGRRSYHGESSMPPSPLTSPTLTHASLPSPNYISSEYMQSQRPNPPRLRQSLPPIPQRLPQTPRPQIRPATTTYSTPPRIDFSPEMAYNPSRNYDDYQNTAYVSSPQAINAASFYNSAVSSHIFTPRPGISVRPQPTVSLSDNRSRHSQAYSTDFPASGAFSSPSPATRPWHPSGAYRSSGAEVQTRWATSESQFQFS